jgi:Na+/H+ antiporter NhaD/arsenite permease-like protein
MRADSIFARTACTLALALAPQVATAAELDGSRLGPLSALPFAGMLLSIAVLPLFAHRFWEHHQGKIAAFWACLGIIPVLSAVGLAGAGTVLLGTLLHEYLPFILLLTALFTIAGGIVVRGNLHGSPAMNTALLAIGAGLASIIGTTGAAMVMIQPVLRANDDRKRNAHIVVFFIFLVANIGGSLTPLGDPPLFLGYLNGVDFFWTTTHLFPETLALVAALLLIFFILDSIIYRADGHSRPDPTPDVPLRLYGGVNFLLIAIVIAAILLSARLDFGAIAVGGVELRITDALRDGVMVLATAASLAFTPLDDREANGFDWGPIKEVAMLFAGIFVSIVPVLAMLAAGRSGALGALAAAVEHPDGTHIPAAYFWMTGALSSFLDNAPTYLVFFQLAGGDAGRLMTADALTLAAISAGAVFMGANTYIGNAPNFMVYAIARRAGVKMPGFFGYMAWSGAILVPLFLVQTLVFFR